MDPLTIAATAAAILAATAAAAAILARLTTRAPQAPRLRTTHAPRRFTANGRQ